MTSLDEIAKHDPCYDGWESILRHRGHEPCLPEHFAGDDTLFKVSDIGNLGRVEWLCWSAVLFEGNEDALKIYRWFALWCAERMKPRMKNPDSIDALKVCRDYLEGNASKEQLKEAETSAYEAAISNHSTSAAAYHGFSSVTYSFYFWAAPSLAEAYSYSAGMSAYHAVLSASYTSSFLAAPCLEASYSYSSAMYGADKKEQMAKLREALDLGSHISLTKECLAAEYSPKENDSKKEQLVKVSESLKTGFFSHHAESKHKVHFESKHKSHTVILSNSR